MKKLFLSLVAAIVVTTATYAQNTLVATLSHGDAVSMFYGSSALINAVEAAESGDVITLSGGKFTCANFTKAVSIMGTGVDAENPTIIGYTDYYGQYNSIAIPQDDNNRFSMEGCIVNLYYYINGNSLDNNLEITGNSSNLFFLKCRFLTCGISFSSSGTARFVNCDFPQFNLSGSGNVKFTNCYVEGFKNDADATSKAEFINCLLSGNFYNTKINRSSFVNCILFDDRSNSGYSLPSETSVMNCLAVGMAFGFNSVASPIDCYAVDHSEIPSIFKTYSSSKDRWNIEWFYPTAPYELTDDAKATYIGTDGKEVGLYGGQYPYNFTPNYPRINKLNVAKQTTADNKLSVEIEVSAAE